MAAGADFAAVLASRRMCRDFLADPVEESVLERVLAAAFRAPAAGNTDALQLLVLDGAEVADYWDVTLARAERERFAWPGLLLAPVLVVPYVDPQAYTRRYGRADKVTTGLGGGTEDWPVPYWWVDGGAAVMAMLLAAESEGLGALLFGQFHHERSVAGRFGVPGGLRALGTVALGRPAPGGRRPSRSASGGRPSPSGRVHRSGFGGAVSPGRVLHPPETVADPPTHPIWSSSP